MRKKKSYLSMILKCNRLFTILKSARVPGIVCDVLILSLKLTVAMTVEIIRLFFPRSKKSLIGEIALITGAGHGIGRELSIQLAEMGCIVVCWDCDKDRTLATVRTISKNGGEVYGYVVDVSKQLQVAETAKLMEKSGVPQVSLLINNAAILLHQPILSHNPEDIERIFGVNLFSHFWTIETFLPEMLKSNKGHIVAMSSMCGMYGVSKKVAYCSTKYGVRGLMESLQDELHNSLKKKPNVHLTVVYPFYVDTGLAKDPHMRFPSIFGVVSPEFAAKEIITAVRRNYTRLSIPRCLLHLDSLMRILPDSVVTLILDFLWTKRSKKK